MGAYLLCGEIMASIPTNTTVMVKFNNKKVELNSKGFGRIHNLKDEENTLSVTVQQKENQKICAFTETEGELVPLAPIGSGKSTTTGREYTTTLNFDSEDNRITTSFPTNTINLACWNKKSKIGTTYEIGVFVNEEGTCYVCMTTKVEFAYITDGSVFFPTFGKQLSKLIESNLIHGSELKSLPFITEYISANELVSFISKLNLTDKKAIIVDMLPATGHVVIVTNKLRIAVVPFTSIILNNVDAKPEVGCIVGYDSFKKADQKTTTLIQNWTGSIASISVATGVVLLEEMTAQV
ncbi:MAG: hypothetical protein US50_C0004G0010 [Candidatus Nomurabacteria bacterium GW2011_GWB1_37_5]|uniref:Uncharacterized protein n=1 Tax=Candidatus Nomurabacteria bacterium GW2011_GWB1_37_5 TaxID=1618742 RepID=A0A0G0K5A2_9BACT|nr:MAG: hypothetical protein US50_C0004G0010 [Candidatus Nomurabacteria bacterium GW2011_GWB1_37_5]